jgi:hypothetical protein
MGRDIGLASLVSQGSGFPTYSCVINDFAFATTAQDIVNIANPVGSGVELVLTNVYVAFDATAAQTYDIYLSRRSAADTGGTAVLLTQAGYQTAVAIGSGSGTVAARDTNDQASLAVVNAYTANPSAYGAGYLIDAGHLIISAAATPAVPLVPWNPNYTTRGAKPPILRPGQFWGININGQAAPAGISAYISFEWIEVPLTVSY